MKHIIHFKSIYQLILIKFFLLVSIQAVNYYQNSCNEDDRKDNYEVKDDIGDQYEENYLNTSKKESKFFVKREGELMIPANGDCLFTSILLGYLFPVLDNEKEFKKRCIKALGEKEGTKNFNQLSNQLKDASWNNYFQSIQTFFFREVIRSFKNNMKIKAAWGGAKEIQTLCNKLEVAIQEYVPDPEKKNKDLVAPKTMKPQKGQVIETIGIIQDVASSSEKSYDQVSSMEEVHMREKSIQAQIHGQHFRLKINTHFENELKRKNKNHQLSNNLAKKDMNKSKYMKALKEIPFFPVQASYHQTGVYSPLTSPKPHSLESKLALLTSTLKKLAEYKDKKSKSDYNNQANKPNIDSKVPIVANSNSSEDQIGEQGNLKALLLLCDDIEQYGKKYILPSDLKLQMNLGMEKVRDKISKKDFLAANNKTGILLRAIEPVNIEKMLFYAGKAEEASSFIENKNVILFIGATGVGKSTTLLYLMGCKMMEKTKENVSHIEADKESIKEEYQKSIANITSSPLPRSETHYITGVSIKINAQGPTSPPNNNKHDSSDDSDSSDSSNDSDSSDENNSNKLVEVVLCDTPGFEDTNGPEVDIANGTGVIEAIKKATDVKIALLLSTPSLNEERMQSVTKIVHLIGRMMPDFNNHKNSFSYLFTKATQTTKDEINAKFNNLLESAKKGEVIIDKPTKAIMKDIKKKTKKKTWVIDPTRKMKGTEGPKEILNNLVQCDGIKTPSKVFKSYITAKSEEKLMTQLRYHQHAIKVAIDTQNFSLAAYKLYQVQKTSKLLKISKVDNTYQDIVDNTRRKWNNMAIKVQQNLEQGLLSSKLMNSSVIDEYLKAYHLYTHFDSSLRKPHFPDNSTTSNSFMIKLKNVLVELGIKVLHNSFNEPEKTSNYLAKLKQLAKKISSCEAFLENTYQLLNKLMIKKQETFSILISKYQFKEIFDMLYSIRRAQVVQKQLDSNILDIEKVYHTMKLLLINSLRKVLKKSYEALGLEYKKEKLQNKGSELPEKINQSLQEGNSSLIYNFADFNSDRVEQLRHHYTTMEKATLTFSSEEFPHITKVVKKLYDDYIIQAVNFIKASVIHVKQLFESNEGDNDQKARKLIGYIQAFSEVTNDISRKTRNENIQLIKSMSEDLKKREQRINNILNQCLKGEGNTKQNGEDLAAYVKNIQGNQFISRQQKKYKLRELERKILNKLEDAKIKAFVLEPCIDGDNDQDFKDVRQVMKLLNIISESKIGSLFEKVAEYKNIISNEIINKIILKVSSIERSFDTRRSNIEIQEMLLKELEKFKAYFRQDQEIEKKFNQNLKKLPKEIIDQKTLEKAISSLNQDIANKEKLSSECKEASEVENTKKVKALPENHKQDLSQHNEVNKLNKLVSQGKKGKAKNNKEANKLKKDLKLKIEERRDQYEDINSSYKNEKKNINSKMALSIQNMHRTFLTSDMIQKLRNREVDWLDDYIKDLKSKITESKKKKETNNEIWSDFQLNHILNCIQYLNQATRIEWIANNKDGSLEDSRSSIQFTLELDLKEVQKYLKSYIKMVKKSLESTFKVLSDTKDNDDDDNKDSELVDYKVLIEAANEFVNRFYEVVDWLKFYQDELHQHSHFTEYNNSDSFIKKYSEGINNLLDDLDNKLKYNKNLSLEEIINASKVLKVIKKLDQYFDSKGKKASDLYTKYQIEISKEVNDQGILEKIEKREYDKDLRNMIKKLTRKKEAIKESSYSNTIQSIKTKLIHSISDLIEEVESPHWHYIQELKLTDDLSEEQQITIKTLIGKIKDVQNIFFSGSKNFLDDSKADFDQQIDKLKKKVKKWIKDRKKVIQNTIEKGKLATAQKCISLISSVKNIFSHRSFLSDEDCQYNFDEQMKASINHIKKKFHINPFNNSENLLIDLKSFYQELINAEKINEGKELFKTLEDEYKIYLKNIKVSNLNNKLEEESQKLKIAESMLKLMPEDLQKNLERFYKEKVKIFELNQKKFINQLEEIRSTKNNNTDQNIILWNKYSTGSTQHLKEEIMKKIVHDIQTINLQLDELLEKKKLSYIPSLLERLKMYKLKIRNNDFIDTGKIYYQAEKKCLNDIDKVIAKISNTNPARIAENPKKLQNIATNFKNLKEYSKYFLEKNSNK